MVLDVALVSPEAAKVMECVLPPLEPEMLRSPNADVPVALVATVVVPFRVPGVPFNVALTDIPAVLTKLFWASATRTTTEKFVSWITDPGG